MRATRATRASRGEGLKKVGRTDGVLIFVVTFVERYFGRDIGDQK